MNTHRHSLSVSTNRRLRVPRWRPFVLALVMLAAAANALLAQSSTYSASVDKVLKEKLSKDKDADVTPVIVSAKPGKKSGLINAVQAQGEAIEPTSPSSRRSPVHPPGPCPGAAKKWRCRGVVIQCRGNSQWAVHDRIGRAFERPVHVAEHTRSR